MSRVKRLQRIVDLADSATREASQRLGGSRRQRDDSVEKLAQFERYREEYEQHLNSGGITISASRAREIRQFIRQMDNAIRALEQQVRLAEQKYAADQTDWHARSARTRALGEVRDRAAQLMAREAARAEQREVDDRPPRVPG